MSIVHVFDEMDQWHITKSSTVPLTPTATSGENICYPGMVCNERHDLDVEEKATRKIIQSVLDDPISENELIRFKAVCRGDETNQDQNMLSGDGTNQDQNTLRVSAVTAAARYLGSNVKHQIQYRLAWRIVRLHKDLNGVFCPYALAEALSDLARRPHQGDTRRSQLRRAQTMPNNRRLNQKKGHLDFAHSSVVSNEPEDNHRIELWILVGAISLVAGGLLVFGKRPQCLKFS